MYVLIFVGFLYTIGAGKKPRLINSSNFLFCLFVSMILYYASCILLTVSIGDTCWLKYHLNINIASELQSQPLSILTQ